MGKSSNGGNLDVMASSDGTVWIGGGVAGGRPSLLRYFPEKGLVTPFQHRLSTKIPFHKFEINDLLEDSRGNIWLATTYGGLIKISLDQDTILQYKPVNMPAVTIKLTSLIEDRNGRLWMSTSDIGVLCFDPSTGKFENYNHPVNGQPGLTENMTNTLLEDHEGKIWIGTNATGINILNLAESFPNGLTFLQMKDGLPAEHILKMVRDDRQNIWVFTLSGLGLYDIGKKRFRVYDENDGLKGHHSWGMDLYAAGGKIFVGRNGGFYFFDVSSLLRETSPPPVVLTMFKIFEKEQVFSKKLNELEQIILRYDQNFFSIDYAALNFRNTEKNQYAYILEGFSRDWVYPSGGQTTANFTNVPEGTYTFRVIAANDSGVWNREGASIKIVVLPPWYRTWWACLLYLFATGVALYLVYSYQKSRFEFKTRLALEKKEASQLRELNQLRTRLYTNVTHEFRTPLTVIIGLANEIAGNEKYKKLIIRNGQRLLQLVTQILDLSKIEYENMQIHLEKGNVVVYVRYIIESLASLASSRHITLNFSTDIPSVRMDFDPERLQQVLYNLVSNAIKFTPGHGSVSVTVKLQEKTPQPLLEIRVSDTGIGIDEKHLDKIFNPFYQVEDDRYPHSPGTGIGLALTAELVKMMDGRIDVFSERGKGTDFVVLLPVNDREGVREMTPSPVSEETAPFSKATDVQVEQPAAGVTFQENVPAGPVILLVEDNPDLITYLAGILAKEYTLEVANDGMTGIEKAIELVPDLIITDVMMPGANGLELCNRLKNDERTSHIPIILLTAKATIEDRIAGLELGADAYLAKPFHKQELEVEIKKLLTLRKLLQNRYANLPPTELPADQSFKMEDAFVRKAVEAVEANLTVEGFGPDELCKALFVSRSQLHRKLSALTGKSASHFIRTIRLKEAAKLLRQGATVSEAGTTVGYSDLSYFSKVFKEEFGKSPSELRPK